MTERFAPTWRLIITSPLSGAENMAIDEALLRLFDPYSSLPIVRLYSWNPPALSLGRFQKAAEVLDLNRCTAEGVTIVRRVTGGGVIYHADELTYSLICKPDQIPAANSVKDSFRVLTGFLLSFYRTLGLDASYAGDAASEGRRIGERTPFCFAGRESYDVIINGNKIGGNAQRRLKKVIFQHGSIPLQNRAANGITYMSKQLPEYFEDTTSLSDCGIDIVKNDLQHTLAAAFSEYTGAELECDSLSVEEDVDMKYLMKNKYVTDKWNLEGIGE